MSDVIIGKGKLAGKGVYANRDFDQNLTCYTKHMISNKLKNLFLISIPLFIVHGTEEYLTHFYDIYPLLNFRWTENIFQSIAQATFFTFQIMWWVLLIVVYIFLRGGKGTLYLMTFVGLIYIYEITHILSAILMQGYTPGLTTGLLFPFMAFFYWKELLKKWDKNQHG